MSNFAPKLQEATDVELMHMVNELDFRVVPLASDELTRRTVRTLQETIEEMKKQASQQTDKLIRLTWWIVGLTIVMVVGLVVQITLAI